MTQEDINDRLIRAAKINDIKGVNKALQDGADINASNTNNFTTLTTAVSYRHRDIVQLLLKNGADINSPNGYGETALIVAARQGYLNIVSILIKYGADVNKTDLYGSSAVLKACADPINNKNVIYELLAAGADPDISDISGNTPFMNILRFNGTEALVKTFIKQGVNVNSRNWDGQTALIYACKHRSVSTIRRLLKLNADVNAKDNNGVTPFWEACENAYINNETIKVLLDFGANPNIADNNSGATPFLKVCENAYIHGEIIKMLLDFGANPNIAFFDGTTSLMCLASRGNTEFMEILIQSGADVNAKNNKGQTALDILKEYYPDKYETWIDGILLEQKQKKLRKEDSFSN